jgi:hypothetical protein
MNGKRALAWRNLMVAAINVALDRGLIGLEPGPVEAGVYEFTFGGLPALAAVSDSGYGEVAVRACLQPTERGAELVKSFYSGFLAGDCYASSWVAREPGETWLQTCRSPGMFRCRRDLLATVAAVEVEPRGYADHGPLLL